MTFAGEALPHLCHRWDDGDRPKIAEPGWAGAGIGTQHGLVSKWLLPQGSCAFRGIPSVLPRRAHLVQRHELPSLIVWCFYGSSLLGWKLHPFPGWQVGYSPIYL